MPFTSETANLKHNAGMSKDDIDQGYEVLPMDPLNDSMVNRRLGLTSPWIETQPNNLVEWSD